MDVDHNVVTASDVVGEDGRCHNTDFRIQTEPSEFCILYSDICHLWLSVPAVLAAYEYTH
jgi:hypothetical protein